MKGKKSNISYVLSEKQIKELKEVMSTYQGRNKEMLEYKKMKKILENASISS